MRFDYGAVFARSRTVADRRVNGVHYLMKKNRIMQYDGRGTLTDPHTVQVALTADGSETARFDHRVDSVMDQAAALAQGTACPIARRHRRAIEHTGPRRPVEKLLGMRPELRGGGINNDRMRGHRSSPTAPRLLRPRIARASEAEAGDLCLLAGPGQRGGHAQAVLVDVIADD